MERKRCVFKGLERELDWWLGFLEREIKRVNLGQGFREREREVRVLDTWREILGVSCLERERFGSRDLDKEEGRERERYKYIEGQGFRERERGQG